MNSFFILNTNFAYIYPERYRKRIWIAGRIDEVINKISKNIEKYLNFYFQKLFQNDMLNSFSFSPDGTRSGGKVQLFGSNNVTGQRSYVDRTTVGRHVSGKTK